MTSIVPESSYICVRGARENNLRDVSLDIPKHKITAFTGVSGSGKSSLVFGTIAAESQRIINETYPAFVQQFLPNYGQPDVDLLQNISVAIVVDQQRLGGNSRSTVATVTDTAQMLRVLFSQIAEPKLGPPSSYNYNDPRGMCKHCEGVGTIAQIDLAAVYDDQLSLNDGALLTKDFAVDSMWWDVYKNSGLFDMNKPISKFTDSELQDLLYLEDGRKVKVGKMAMTYEGVVIRLKRVLGAKDPDALKPHLRAEYDRVFKRTICPSCKGTRFNEAVMESKIAGNNISDLYAMEVSDLVAAIGSINASNVAPIVNTLSARLESLVRVGLGYLSLDRESTTLSGGESQRVKMVRHLGSSLVDLMYVFDEPSVGLHPHDVGLITELVQQLCKSGNTVLIVEHNPEMISIADHVVDIGPRAGSFGGEIVYEGDYLGLVSSNTLTSKCLKQQQAIKTDVRQKTGELWVRNARINNLDDVSVAFPESVLTVVTGVSGSGKTSLVMDGLAKVLPDAIIIDQSLARGSRRSNTATWTGILDPIRKAFAKANDVVPGLFSANSKGACPDCSGLGMVFTDLAHLDPVATTCETCAGKRFLPEVLELQLRGKSIADVYEMSIETAKAFFVEPPIASVLAALYDVGLGYLTLGQPLSTLSGGERQRLKLAAEMGKSGNIYLLDEPTSGLHMHDVQTMIEIFDRFVDDGSTVIVIEHNLDVISRADWIVDMGPGAGHNGGRILFEGVPADLTQCQASVTGGFLSDHNKH